MRRTIVQFMPHSKSELKDEHFLMAAAYGFGSFFAHSVIGLAVVGLGYMMVALIAIKSQHGGC